MLWSYKKYQKIGAERGLGRVKIKYLFAQTIPDKMFGTKWSNPVKLDRKKKFGNYFCVILTGICKVQFLEGGLGTRLCAHPNLRFS